MSYICLPPAGTRSQANNVFESYGAHRALHSFPTRRSSDLGRGRRLPGPAADAEAVRRDVRGVPYDDHRSEEHTSELQSLTNIVCRLLLENTKASTTMTESPSAAKTATPSNRPAPTPRMMNE